MFWVLVLFLGWYNPVMKQEASVSIRAFTTHWECREAKAALLRGQNPGDTNDNFQCVYEKATVRGNLDGGQP